MRKSGLGSPVWGTGSSDRAPGAHERDREGASHVSSRRVSGASERFELRERLGPGACGVVWRAYDRERRGTVALKQLRTLAPDALLRFKTEFRALQDLNHPNVVHFHELFEDEGRWFFTMELSEGVELLEWVGIDTSARPRTAVTQIRTGRELARAEGTPPGVARPSLPSSPQRELDSTTSRRTLVSTRPEPLQSASGSTRMRPRGRTNERSSPAIGRIASASCAAEPTTAMSARGSPARSDQ